MGKMRICQALGFTGLSLATLLAGCGGEGDEVSASSSALEATNALSANALSANALSANALSANALSANALSANGLRDPLARQFLKYVVSCALPASSTITMSIDGASYSFVGQLGLAPQWGAPNGSCDRSCQRWVSACVLARVDYAGVERLISLRGEHPALRTAPHEVSDYPVREATYYGNLFGEGQKRYLCLSPGLHSDERVCGPSLANCPMTVMGSCATVCEDTGRQGSFVDCATDATFAKDGGRQKSRDIAETVTVFLPR
ncbi:MAG: hypothetical protein ABI560_04015 [Myxococcales bacterium]